MDETDEDKDLRASRRRSPLAEELHHPIFPHQFVTRFVFLVQMFHGGMAKDGIEEEVPKPTPAVLNGPRDQHRSVSISMHYLFQP